MRGRRPGSPPLASHRGFADANCARATVRCPRARTRLPRRRRSLLSSPLSCEPGRQNPVSANILLASKIYCQVESLRPGRASAKTGGSGKFRRALLEERRNALFALCRLGAPGDGASLAGELSLPTGFGLRQQALYPAVRARGTRGQARDQCRRGVGQLRVLDDLIDQPPLERQLRIE